MSNRVIECASRAGRDFSEFMKGEKGMMEALASVDEFGEQLRVNARCPTIGATSTGGLGDASSPRLTDSAERDYFTLRERIVTVTKQVGYLQDYIKEQCLK
ncbi:lysis protein [Salmonella enterica]|nr:lysis protein [Salmonella enterica]EBF9365021.1 lysis protein [Salmonella enterica subsp. enterica serovar Thompson]EAB4404753.1 lysis protein [Salmonella enterica]EAM3272286.1 lysis protein [Salmonella enterica]EAM6412644.1 lysis protein [Salmonella enterica]